MRQKSAYSMKEHLFLLAIFKGERAPEAYRQAGYKASTENTLNASASRLLNSDKIQTALQAMRSRSMARAEVTQASVAAELDEIRLAALASDPPQLSAAVAAAIGKAKLFGLMVDRKLVGVVQHKPALTSSALELSVEDWQAQFDPAHALPKPQDK